MRVLIINKFLYPNGGSETYIFKLGEALEQHGHEVQYFGMEHEGRCVGNRVNAYTSDMDFHGGSKLSKLTYPIKQTVKPRHAFSKKTVSKVGLLVDIEVAIRSGKGPGYERWAKVFNLKQLSQAVLYLKEHGDMGYEDLLEKANATTTNFNTLSVQIKDLESKMNANAELQKQIVNYAKTRAVYVEYRKAGYSKKFRTEHEAEILLHQAAKNHFDELGIKKLPSVKSLREEYTDLLEQKRKAYSAYKQAKNDMKELHNVRANVEYLLEISSPPQPQRSTEKSRQ